MDAQNNVNNKKYIRYFYRGLFWILGQFLIAMGIVFSVKSDLGVASGSLIPLALNMSSGLSLGTCMVIFFIGLLILQIVLLRKEFELINLLQVIGSVIFGAFTDLITGMLSGITAETYPTKLLFIILGVVIQSIGIAIYVDTHIMFMSAEGATDALHRKVFKKVSFGTARVLFDVSLLVLGVLLSLILLRKIVGVREGTIVMTFGVGKVMGFIHSKVEKPLKKLFYGTDEPAAECVPESGSAS